MNAVLKLLRGPYVCLIFYPIHSQFVLIGCSGKKRDDTVFSN